MFQCFAFGIPTVSANGNIFSIGVVHYLFQISPVESPTVSAGRLAQLGLVIQGIEVRSLGPALCTLCGNWS